MALYDEMSDNEIYDSESDERESNESESDERESNESENEDEELRYESMVEIARSRHDDNKGRMKYTVLSLNDIGERLHNATKSVSTVLAVSEAEAAILLRHFDWNSINANDQWFADEEKVRNAVGLLLQPDDKHETKEEKMEELTTCPICFYDFKIRDMKSLKYCDHLFCQDCWRTFIHTSINHDGAGCLNLRCPHQGPHQGPRCRGIVSEDMVFSLGLSEEDTKKYRSYLVRSYVEQNSMVKWCPAPDCPYCVEVDSANSNVTHEEVVCNCSHKFCWNCLEESHRPIGCDTVKKWIDQINNGDSLNAYWIFCNSKPCPKCGRPIEKNQGCMHMTCASPCGFQFCWLCLGDWFKHNSCNQYSPDQVATTSGRIDAGNQSRNSASVHSRKMFAAKTSSSDRLVFYMQRWKANEKSEEKALSDLQAVQEVEIKRLNECQQTRMSRSGLGKFKCVVDAWLQIAECRHMLKWTYAYGYYLTPASSNHDQEADIVRKKQILFEFLQGEAESSLERLHHCVEQELQDHIEITLKDDADTMTGKKALRDFDDFCIRLEKLTKSTGQYFENLIQGFENNLSEVSRIYAPAGCA